MEKQVKKLVYSRLGAAIFLTLILLLAASARLPALARIPNGLFCDEASAGYDAYSVLHTFRDQYGNFLPLYARSFGDYDEFLYRYLTVPAIAAFGLNEFATRLPAALAGILTVFFIYQLGRKFWGARVGLLAALLLALNPWHIHFSRIAFRAILFPLFFCAALFFFLEGVRKPHYRIASAVTFAVSLYTYSSARFFVPIFLVGLVAIYRDKLLRHWKFTLGAGLLLCALAFPAVRFWFTAAGMARAEATLNFSPAENLWWYLSYFSPRFLFFNGDPYPRQHAGFFGELYPFEILSVCAGIIAIVKTFFRIKRLAPFSPANFFFSFPGKYALLVLWLALYPLPATLTDPETSLRSIIGAPLFALLSAFGFDAIYRYAKTKIPPLILAGGFAATLAGFFLAFTYNYYVIYPQKNVADWQYGMRDAMRYAETHPYDRVWVSDQFFLPHIFILYYAQYPPDLYQQQPLDKIWQNHWHYSNYTIGKYHIGSSQRAEVAVARQGTLLLILPSGEYDAIKTKHVSWRKVNEINMPDGDPVITLVEVK